MRFTCTSLSNVPVSKIAELFNEAFKGYFIPISFTGETLSEKFIAENIIPGYSVIAYEGEKPAGFILTGIDTIKGKLHAYNAGTGVIPEYRNQRLTEQMYRFLLGLLTDLKVQHHQLEVITANEKARYIYEKTGFSVSRKLLCLRKSSVVNSNISHYRIDEIPVDDVSGIKLDFDYAPSWQNSPESMLRMRDHYKTLTIILEGKTAGLIIFSPDKGRLKYLFVDRDSRRQGIGSALLNHASSMIDSQQMNFINLDENDVAALAFLKANGWEVFLEQYEMKMNIEPAQEREINK